MAGIRREMIDDATEQLLSRRCSYLSGEEPPESVLKTLCRR